MDHVEDGVVDVEVDVVEVVVVVACAFLGDLAFPITEVGMVGCT